MNERFSLKGKRALITGAGGLLGPEHGISLANVGAELVLIDIDFSGLENSKKYILEKVPHANIKIIDIDITNENELLNLNKSLKNKNSIVDILVNNACLNPKMEKENNKKSGTIENYNMKKWKKEIDVGITGTFLCSKIFGTEMANRGYGVIINIASDLAIQAPDQRVYADSGKIEDVIHYKPIGYPVVKSAMLGMNRYLATYWAHKGVRVNCLVPGAVLNKQSASLVKNISYRVPLGRLAEKSEYREVLVFLASDASSYMTGNEIVMDGGRSIW